VVVVVVVQLMAETAVLVAVVVDILIPILLVVLVYLAKVSLGGLLQVDIVVEWLAVVALVRLEILLALVATAGL
jgi:hypothetical protein